MKKVAAGILVGLFLGVVIGYQFAPRTDTSELEGTIGLLLEEVDVSDKLLQASEARVEALDDELGQAQDDMDTITNLFQASKEQVEGLEDDLGQAQDDLEFLHRLLNITVDGLPLQIGVNVTIESPKAVIYQLQNYDLVALEAAGADLYIIDYSKEGDEESRFTSDEVQRLQNVTWDGNVLSYISIGEAEDYRYYWQSDWTRNEPSWLGATNPDWEGNYKVKYWDPDWQEIVFDYIDRIMESGFNGIYLDIIDAYEYWGPDGDSGLDRATAEQDMVDFVVSISEYTKSRDPDFLIYPQNGEALGVHSEYIAAVDGIGREDVWYNDNDVQDDTNTTLWYLSLFADEDKHVIVIDYPTDPELIADFCGKAEALGYSSYPGVRDLDEIRLCPEP